MREIGLLNDGAEIRFIGFDDLHQLAIKKSYEASAYAESSTSVAHTYVHALTTSNFRSVIREVSSSQTSSARHVVVSTVDNLALLGVTEEKFNSEVVFLTLQEFAEILGEDIRSDSMYEKLLTQKTSRSDFFQQTLLTPPQLQLLIHIATGHTNTDIGKLMFLTEKGVESAIKRLSLKLDCEYSSEKPQNLRIILGRKYAQMLGVLNEEKV
ncbi:MAG: hypothetical protein RL130_312 [Actinomycetota bacterium]|jgi:DNA-binding CsgD family transcriptional regulator